jgi:hypothetical protein
MPRTKCLVLGSCTGQKDDVDCPEDLKLRETDFSSASGLAKAERKAKRWLKPAGQMYKGRQHTLMMNGVNRLRAGFTKALFDVSIVSAGYGLISEERRIAPYDITFQGKGLPWARERGAALKIPTMTRELLPQYQVVLFLLGKEYLSSLESPPEPAPGQKFIYFGTAVERFRMSANSVVIIPAAQKEATRYGGAGVTGIKGRMFDLFAQGMTDHPNRWKSFIADRTADTLVDVMSEGKRAH